MKKPIVSSSFQSPNLVTCYCLSCIKQRLQVQHLWPLSPRCAFLSPAYHSHPSVAVCVIQIKPHLLHWCLQAGHVSTVSSHIQPVATSQQQEMCLVVKRHCQQQQRVEEKGTSTQNIPSSPQKQGLPMTFKIHLSFRIPINQKKLLILYIGVEQQTHGRSRWPTALLYLSEQ